MTISTVDSFLDLVRRSGLVEKDQLNAVLVDLQQQAGGVAADRRRFRRQKVRRGRSANPLAMRQYSRRPPQGILPRQIQAAGSSWHRRHEQRLSGRTRADAAPRGHQGVAQRTASKTRPIWPDSTARPKPPPLWIIATSSARTTSTTTATSTTW